MHLAEPLPEQLKSAGPASPQGYAIDARNP
jgi:hypothetical protein